MFKLISNIINKGLKIFKVFLKKVFKVKSYNRNCTMIAILVLDSFKVDSAIKKDGKQDIVYFSNIL